MQPKFRFHLIRIIGTSFKTTILIFLFTNSVLAQSKTKAQDELDKLLLTEIKQEQIPGLSFAVVRNGKIIDQRTYGFANVELKSPAKSHTKFATGSIGKVFTACAIMLLENQGKLSIDDPITKHIRNVPKAWSSITIRQLLSHTSGIKDYAGESMGYESVRIDRKKEYTDSTAIQLFADHPLNFSPGTNFAYSNTGYMLLGIIIRNASGMSRGEYLKKYFFDPLNMKDTEEIKVSQVISDRASGYYTKDSVLYNGFYVGNYFAATGEMGLMTTAVDMAKFDISIHNGEIIGADKLITMQTPGKTLSITGGMYGLGWSISYNHTNKVVGHSGSYINGFSSDYRHFTSNLAVTLFTNLNNANTSKLLSLIAKYYDKDLTSTDRYPIKKISDSPNDTFIKKFFLGETSAIEDSLNMTSSLRLGLNKAAKSFFKTNAAASTGFESVAFEEVIQQKLEANSSPIKTIRYYKLSFGNESVYVSAYYTSEGKLALYRVVESL